MMNRIVTHAMPRIVLAVAFALSGACGGAHGGSDRSDEPAPPSIGTAAEADTPLPLDVASRLHGCQKVAYASLGTFLKGRGVNLALTSTPPSAGQLYAGATDTLGVPKIDSRLREPSFLTTAGATKLFDIFMQAAPEIIQNISDAKKAPACTLNGANKPMFDAGGCVEDSVTCLIGRPATPNDVILCNLLLAKADPKNPADVAIKQQITVATMLSAAHTCE